MKDCRFSITATLTCAITIFTIGNCHPVEVKTGSPLLNTDTEIVDFAKNIGSELLEIEPSGRTVRKYEKDTLRDSDQTFLCTGQGQVGVPHECKRYHVCARAGAESGGGVCFGDKFFHHQKRECLKITEAQCHASMCKNISNKFRDPYNRENYLVCTNMVPEIRRCPDGKIYYPQLRSCESGSAMKGLKESFEEEEEKVLATRNKVPTGIGEIRPKNKMGRNKQGQPGIQGNNGQPGNNSPQTLEWNSGQFGMPGNNSGQQTIQTKNVQPGLQGSNGQPGIAPNNRPQTLDVKDGQFGMQGQNGQSGIPGSGPQIYPLPVSTDRPQIYPLPGLKDNNGQPGMQGQNGQPGIPGNGPQIYPLPVSTNRPQIYPMPGLKDNNGQPGMPGNGPQIYPLPVSTNRPQIYPMPGLKDNNGQPGMPRNGPQIYPLPVSTNRPQIYPMPELKGNNGQPGMPGDNNGPQTIQTKDVQPGIQGNSDPQINPASNGQPVDPANEAQPGQVQTSQSESINKKKRQFKNREEDSEEDYENEEYGSAKAKITVDTASAENNGDMGAQDADGKSIQEGSVNSAPEPAEVTGERLVLPPADEEKR